MSDSAALASQAMLAADMLARERQVHAARSHADYMPPNMLQDADHTVKRSSPERGVTPDPARCDPAQLRQGAGQLQPSPKQRSVQFSNASGADNERIYSHAQVPGLSGWVPQPSRPDLHGRLEQMQQGQQGRGDMPHRQNSPPRTGHMPGGQHAGNAQHSHALPEQRAHAAGLAVPSYATANAPHLETWQNPLSPHGADTLPAQAHEEAWQSGPPVWSQHRGTGQPGDWQSQAQPEEHGGAFAIWQQAAPQPREPNPLLAHAQAPPAQKTSVRVRGAHVADSCPFATDAPAAARGQQRQQAPAAPQPDGYATAPVLYSMGAQHSPPQQGDVPQWAALAHSPERHQPGYAPQQPAQQPHQHAQPNNAPPQQRHTSHSPDRAPRTGTFMGTMHEIRAGPSDAQRAHAEQMRDQLKQDLQQQVCVSSQLCTLAYALVSALVIAASNACRK